ncbi:MAG: UDP-N-acetylglucosamine 2-epimerase (non-hydrolyzing) [Clostridia bacterium]|nr:UDP-N-acetylglucosamine 2-epimerase (non-hydrolyzing) [Clostridia bacterium]
MEEKRKIMSIFGTRPEAIKLCPLIEELRQREGILCRVCVTGQHREMLDQVLGVFDLRPDYDLAIMREGQDLFDITTAVLTGLRPILMEERPDLVLVHGDTTTAFAAALACFYLKIPVGHVEAGLRTYDLRSPFPEEWNRQALTKLAVHHFAPTERARENLLREGVPSERILVTGNTGLDALRKTVREGYTHPELEWARGSRLLLLTLHRRESVGAPMARIFRALRRILSEFEDVKILYSMHPNPAIRSLAWKLLGSWERVHLIDPPNVLDFHNLMANCDWILTDSGGIQEEAPSLHKPVLVLRESTERPEGLEAGCTRLVGTGEESVYRGVRELLENPALFYAMSHSPNPFGDGDASRRIADYLNK